MAKLGERWSRNPDGTTEMVPADMTYEEWQGKFVEGLTSATETDIINNNSFVIGRSVGAKAKNYDILDLETGEIYHFVEGTKIQNVEVFAGKGSRVVFRNASFFVNRYGGKAEDWQHAKGFGLLETPDGDREAEVHWVQCAGLGKFEFFLKEWLD